MNVAEVTRAMATVALLGTLAVIAIVVARAGRAQPVKGALGLVLGMMALAGLLTVVSNGLVFVQPEERGVVISALAPKGYREEALQPGSRWRAPSKGTTRSRRVQRTARSSSSMPRSFSPSTRRRSSMSTSPGRTATS